MRITKHIVSIPIVLILAGGILFAQGRSEKQETDLKPTIALSILPQEYFVQRIAGDLVHTVVLVGEGQSPHSYEPTPSQMASLAKAKAWILSGTDFEQVLEDKVSSLYPNLLVVDGTRGVTFRSLEEHDHDDQQAPDEHAIGEDSLERDRHTWLGWESSKILASHVLETAVMLLPEQKALLEANYQQLIADIDATFHSLKEKLEPLAGRKVFVYHPSFGYFFDEFALVQEAVEIGGKEPTAKDLSLLIQKAKSEKAVALFVQKQFPLTSAQTVAKAAGAKVLALDPLARDWMENIQQMGDALLSTIGGDL
ncbi:MAG: metal ABC transporter substrate-binding protein [Spirochaetia bacterium]|nr:metal ABC transporter substrate-binding protein [Spirochaetia bacterium]